MVITIEFAAMLFVIVCLLLWIDSLINRLQNTQREINKTLEKNRVPTLYRKQEYGKDVYTKRKE